MRQFDDKGLMLCKTQGNLFVESIDRFSGGSANFIKRYMNSTECRDVDDTLEFNSSVILSGLEQKYDLNIGKKKYDKDIIYWIGYLYRYWAYVYQMPSSRIFEIVSANELYDLYGAYHTISADAAIERICEARNISVNMDIMEIMKRIYL